jgi:hypothetical protein
MKPLNPFTKVNGKFPGKPVLVHFFIAVSFS